jgi:hypothetical protein
MCRDPVLERGPRDEAPHAVLRHDVYANAHSPLPSLLLGHASTAGAEVGAGGRESRRSADADTPQRRLEARCPPCPCGRAARTPSTWRPFSGRIQEACEPRAAPASAIFAKLCHRHVLSEAGGRTTNDGRRVPTSVLFTREMLVNAVRRRAPVFSTRPSGRSWDCL